MAACVLLWFGCIASIVCWGQRWLRCVLLVLVPGIHLGGVGVCCVPSATCFWAGCGETAVSVSHVCVCGQCYVWVFFWWMAWLISRVVMRLPWRWRSTSCDGGWSSVMLHCIWMRRTSSLHVLHMVLVVVRAVHVPTRAQLVQPSSCWVVVAAMCWRVWCGGLALLSMSWSSVSSCSVRS